MRSRQQGFSVLISTIALSVAGIVFTANMALSQLIDNQVLGNYYRNNEALINAESGINFVLSKLDTVPIANNILNNLPYIYPVIISTDTPYQVQVIKKEGNKLSITSTGKSQDGSASREVSLQVFYSLDFNIPISPLASNGKLNITSAGTINDGCEGLSKEACRSAGNISEMLVMSQPSLEVNQSEYCTGNSLGENNIHTNAIYGNNKDENGGSRFKIIDTDNHWPAADSALASIFEQVAPISNMATPQTLFESTYGITLTDGLDELASSGEVAHIDMTGSDAVSCSEQLMDIGDEVVIYIKGDCNINTTDFSYHDTYENKRFTVGTVEQPKLVFIEGGTFIEQPDSGVSVIGMLYFLPSVEDTYVDSNEALYGYETVVKSVVMDGVRVNGALYSEYDCSSDQSNKMDVNDTKQRFSTRYDKRILNNLYEQLGMEPQSSSYQLVQGSWKDF